MGLPVLLLKQLSTHVCTKAEEALGHAIASHTTRTHRSARTSTHVNSERERSAARRSRALHVDAGRSTHTPPPRRPRRLGIILRVLSRRHRDPRLA